MSAPISEAVLRGLRVAWACLMGFACIGIPAPAEARDQALINQCHEVLEETPEHRRRYLRSSLIHYELGHAVGEDPDRLDQREWHLRETCRVVAGIPYPSSASKPVATRVAARETRADLTGDPVPVLRDTAPLSTDAGVAPADRWHLRPPILVGEQPWDAIRGLIHIR